ENEQRHLLFPYVQEVLKNPDEVWLNEYKNGKYQSNYIKFYRDKMLIVNVELNKKSQGIEVNTWFGGKVADKDLRKGILIKKRKSL
ncbi:PBECR2 nuclease fold domain-containing protein, partial [Ornithobacterium rhinotracheale]